MARHLHFLAICVCITLVALLAPAPSAAAAVPRPEPVEGPVKVNYFTLSKSEAAKGEQVVARWSFTGRARQVRVSTGTEDGILLGYSWQANLSSLRASALTSTGELTFTVPYSLYTLSPMQVVLYVDGAFVDSVPLLITCDYPWFFTPRSSRCPDLPIQPSWAAYQEFEHGRMVWIGNRGYVYVFYNPEVASEMAGRWETFEDHFREGDAETDPSIQAPEGRVQPKRGFGLVWRTQPRVRDVLGWALSPERGYTACFGGGFGGRKSFQSYLNDPSGNIMALRSEYFPTTWSVYTPGVPVNYMGCG